LVQEWSGAVGHDFSTAPAFQDIMAAALQTIQEASVVLAHASDADQLAAIQFELGSAGTPASRA